MQGEYRQMVLIPAKMLRKKEEFVFCFVGKTPTGICQRGERAMERAAQLFGDAYKQVQEGKRTQQNERCFFFHKELRHIRKEPEQERYSVQRLLQLRYKTKRDRKTQESLCQEERQTVCG